jgi:tetrathionate reductase subunit B
MGKKILIIDAEKCVACYNCFIACKDEFVDHSWLPYSEAQPDHGPAFIAVNEVERGRFPKVKIRYIPRPCLQCESPACQKAARDDAVYKREDGVVIIDPVKSKGQRQIAKACSFGAILWNEALDIPQKCTLCIHLLEQGWSVPRCVEVCPTEALRYGDEEEFFDLTASAETLDPRCGRRPGVYYLGLPGTFIAGTAYSSDNGDCLEGVQVELRKEAEAGTTATTTNNYGDFEFEGIEKGSKYSLRIEAEGYYPVTIENIDTVRDIYLDQIMLQKRI